MAPFLDAPLAVEPFARFASENVQIGSNSSTEKNILIVFSRPGLSQEGNARWACPTAPGSQRTGTTPGTQRRKSSIGDQIGHRIRLDQPKTFKPRKPTEKLVTQKNSTDFNKRPDTK